MDNSMEFEVWRERRRDLLCEAAERRLAREAWRGRMPKPEGFVRGFVSGIARGFRRLAPRGGSVAVARHRRCEE